MRVLPKKCFHARVFCANRGRLASRICFNDNFRTMFASAPSIFCACFRARKQQMLFLRDTFCFSTAPEIGSSRTMPITRKPGSVPIEWNDELILLASPIFRARIHDIVEFIEDLLTSIGQDSSLTYGITCEDERTGSRRL